MAQFRDNWIEAQDMVRSRAWRQGFEAFRRGEPLDYAGPRAKSLAYEYGRLTAAWLTGQGLPLRWVSSTRPINEHYVPELAEALQNALVERGGPG